MNAHNCDKSASAITEFVDYQIKWLKSHDDIELEPELESAMIRMLTDAGRQYIAESHAQEPRGDIPVSNRHEDTGIESHEEKEILKGCIQLMQEMADYFGEYLAFVGYEPESEEEKQSIRMSYFHIVNRLFLFHTRHSGGTSTMAKCKELDIEDSSETVEFPFMPDNDE